MAEEEHQQKIEEVKNFLQEKREDPILALPFAKLDTDCISEVAKFVGSEQGCFVLCLDLRGNKFPEGSARTLAKNIRKNRSLKSLNFALTAIGLDHAGLEQLCNALRSNLTVTLLDLRSANIDRQGCQYIAELLAENKVISQVDLSSNSGIGAEGGIEIMKGLQKNPSSALTQLRLEGSKVGRDILAEAVWFARKNRKKLESMAPAIDPAAFTKPPIEAPALPGGERFMRIPFGGSVKDGHRLMVKLMRKERDAVTSEEKAFHLQLHEHIQSLLAETQVHRRGRTNVEDRVKIVREGFAEREIRYIREVKAAEDNLQISLADRLVLDRQINDLQGILKRAEEELQKIKDEWKVKQEEYAKVEVDLKAKVVKFVEKRKEAEDKLSLNNKDLAELTEENERMREHWKRFQKDIQTFAPQKEYLQQRDVTHLD